MNSEREYLSRLESANVEEFAAMVAAPTVEQEEILRTHLGDDAYRRMHTLAVRTTGGTERGIFDLFGGKTPETPKWGNVVMLPGLMGSELTTRDRGSGSEDTIWLSIPRLMFGQIRRLRLAAEGRGEHDSRYCVNATGILKRYYGELMLSLARRWNVKAFWYDWRKDLDTSAVQLLASIDRWFGKSAPVHLVAHSMGGLVARTFIARHPQRWESMKDPDGSLKRGGRLVMLGTPNHGSYLVVQAATGLADTVQLIERVDQRHDMNGIREIVNSFVGPFQMLPSPEIDGDALYDIETYGSLGMSDKTLERAHKHHREVLSKVVTPERMVYVAGSNQPTIDGLTNWERTKDPKTRHKKIMEPESYTATLSGDGSVSHRLGLLKGVKTYFVEEEHSALTSNGKVLAGLDALLRDGETTALSGGVIVRRQKVSSSELIKEIEAHRAEDLQRVGDLTRRLRSRGFPRRGVERAAGDQALDMPAEAPPLTQLERETTDLIVRKFLKHSEEPSDREAARASEIETGHLSLGIALVHGSIGQPDQLGLDDIDAIAVGHYSGVRPQNAERAVDEYISNGLKGGGAPEPGSPTARAADGEATEGPDEPASPDLILTQFTDRGLISGHLGHPFILPDPNDTDHRRVVVLIGMGDVGGCGRPELTILTRELGWALGRMGKKHLATVLIGSGIGNLSVRDAIEAWVRGLAQAVRGCGPGSTRRLEQLTFVETSKLRLREIQRAILDVQRLLTSEGRFQIEFKPIEESELERLEDEGVEEAKQKLEADLKARRSDSRASEDWLEPTRLTVGIERNSLDPKRATYRFGAITATASIPERVTTLDTTLVGRANDEIVRENILERQRERGEFLGRLLIPRDLRSHLNTPAPLVILVDSDTARIHWEMVAQPDPRRERGKDDEEDHEDDSFDQSFFLGTYRSLTRQLRTAFAGPPEPPPPAQRVLRVLIVADPAEDAHLPGAEEEALAVLDLFEAFNALAGSDGGTGNRIEVRPLLGPREATPTKVLCELTTGSYDLLHYAGHAFFHKEHPSQSGWLFSKGVVISANELNQVDRVPTFVVSNACESGITPERAGNRSADLVPSFAEAFFERGVKNFIGTAWPVDDLAARIFAVTLYSHLLGLEAVEETTGDGVGVRFQLATGRERFRPLHVAMREARRAVARTFSGAQTWGAYQHYGNPYSRLFESTTVSRADSRAIRS